MKSILEEIYFGNILQDVSFNGGDPHFVKAMKLKQACSEKLLDTLTEAQRELFEKYQEAEIELESISQCNTFTYALKFGALFMPEVFTGVSRITVRD